MLCQSLQKKKKQRQQHTAFPQSVVTRFRALFALSHRNMIGKHIACVSVQATLLWLGFEGVVL